MYDDIINMPHKVSNVHKRMSLYNRAAQFAPFAALTGYNEAINETKRYTSKKIELDEEEKSIINNKLIEIESNINSYKCLNIKYFVKDKLKDGGSYYEVTGYVKRIDTYNNLIILTNNKKIHINDIISISDM